MRCTQQLRQSLLLYFNLNNGFVLQALPETYRTARSPVRLRALRGPAGPCSSDLLQRGSWFVWGEAHCRQLSLRASWRVGFTAAILWYPREMGDFAQS